MTHPPPALAIARKTAAFLFALFFLVIPARADNVTLPLGGYFHPGRAMPVRWEMASSASEVEISGKDSIATRIECDGKGGGIAPWIVIEPDAAGGKWKSTAGISGNISNLHAIDDSEFLVGTSVSDPAMASLFPKRRIITVPLDADNLRGPAMAWETLDALVLSAPEMQRISARTRGQLFAEGVMLVARSGDRPDAELPWARHGEWWMATSGLPLPPMISDDAYSPVEGWTAERPESYRRRLFLFAVVYCLVFGGVCLWKSRWMPIAAASISLVAVGIFVMDGVRQSPTATRGGVVRLQDQTTMEDHWLFQISPRATTFREVVNGPIHPVFADDAQATSMGVELYCDASGEPTVIGGQLPADEPFALVSRRRVADVSDSPMTTTVTSPLRLLARDSIYPGFTVAGQSADSSADAAWPMVLLVRP